MLFNILYESSENSTTMFNIFFKLAFSSLVVINIVFFALVFVNFKSLKLADIQCSGEMESPPLNRGYHWNTRNNTASVLIIYWSKVFGATPKVSVNPDQFPYFYTDNNCPVNCILTTDKSRIGEASALVVHARNPSEIPPERYKNLTWILHTNENPVFAQSLSNPDFMSKFNYLMSYRLDADFPCPQLLKPSLEEPLEFQRKSGFVMAAYTHCERVRTAYMGELMKYINVDSYGACLHNTKGLNKRYDPRPYDEVRKLQRKYKFSLIFPNADCDYYVTEKIYNALSAGSVPVWLGTDNVDEILKWGNLKHSIIKVKDFSSPQKLAQYLLHLNNSQVEYDKYLKWKYEGFQFPKEYYSTVIAEWWEGVPLYCRVCMRIAVDPEGHDGLQADKCDGNQTRTFKKWLTINDADNETDGTTDEQLGGAGPSKVPRPSRASVDPGY